MSNFVKQHIELRLSNLNKLQDVFDQNVVNVTKQWLKESNEELYFWKNYTYNVSLQIIYFYNDFNGPIPASLLPPNIYSIYFGANFNQPITACVLPPSLQIIYFNINYVHPLPIRPGLQVYRNLI
jgi:hypothetical protein